MPKPALSVAFFAAAPVIPARGSLFSPSPCREGMGRGGDAAIEITQVRLATTPAGAAPAAALAFARRSRIVPRIPFGM